MVISDRYIDSSLAYQGAGRVLPVDEVSWLSSWATGGLRPDLVVLLDIDPATGLARIAHRGPADRLEAENAPFHERVRYAFLDLAGRDPRRYLVVDATLPAEEIAAIVSERVHALLPESTEQGAGGIAMPVPDDEVPAPPTVAEVDLDTGLVHPGANGHSAPGRQAEAEGRAMSNVDSQP
jgi:dTMP kinase